MFNHALLSRLRGKWSRRCTLSNKHWIHSKCLVQCLGAVFEQNLSAAAVCSSHCSEQDVWTGSHGFLPNILQLYLANWFQFFTLLAVHNLLGLLYLSMISFALDCSSGDIYIFLFRCLCRLSILGSYFWLELPARTVTEINTVAKWNRKFQNFIIVSIYNSTSCLPGSGSKSPAKVWMEDMKSESHHGFGNSLCVSSASVRIYKEQCRKDMQQWNLTGLWSHLRLECPDTHCMV